MGYQEDKYIIDPEVDNEKYVVEKPMESVSISNNKLNRDYEVVDVPTPSQNVLEDIHKAAVEEGLVDEEEEYIGGEGAKPEEVIDALIHKERSKGAQKNEEEYIDNKVKKTRKVMATRELLSGITKKILTVTIPMVLDVKQEDGSIKPELCDVDFKVRRLTESQANHVFNKQLAGKTFEDMSIEERYENDHFRAKFLSQVVVDPQMSETEWYETAAIALGTVFNKVNDALSSVDDTELFQ